MKERPDGKSSEADNVNGVERYSDEYFAITAVQRLRIRCICNKPSKEQCAKFLPIQKQRWAGYMGSLGNGFYNDAK